MILPIAGPSKLAIGFYEIDLLIRDAEYVTADGQDSQVLSSPRIIKAAVDPNRSRAMERIFGGSVSQGDIGIYTLVELYFGDQYGTGENQRQSFALYRGLYYRIAEVSDWMPNAGVRVYRGERHIKQDLV